MPHFFMFRGGKSNAMMVSQAILANLKAATDRRVCQGRDHRDSILGA